VLQPNKRTDFSQYRLAPASIKAHDVAKTRLFDLNSESRSAATATGSRPVVTPTSNSSRPRHTNSPVVVPPTASSGNSSRRSARLSSTSVVTPVAPKQTRRGRQRDTPVQNETKRAKSMAPTRSGPVNITHTDTPNSTSARSAAGDGLQSPDFQQGVRSSLRNQLNASRTIDSQACADHAGPSAQHVVNCSCDDPHAYNRLLVPCTDCHQVYHAACVGLTDADSIWGTSAWHCDQCTRSRLGGAFAEGRRLMSTDIFPYGHCLLFDNIDWTMMTTGKQVHMVNWMFVAHRIDFGKYSTVKPRSRINPLTRTMARPTRTLWCTSRLESLPQSVPSTHSLILCRLSYSPYYTDTWSLS
jgi:hypothetical protein